MTSARAVAAELDAADPLSVYRRRFVGDDEVVYLDGNSLGRQTAESRDEALAVLGEWADDLVTGWERWINLPQRLGAAVAPLIGAAPDEVIGCDSTSLNWFKLADAAVRALPNRTAIVVDPLDFPTDRYLASEVARRHGLEIRHLEHDPDRAPTVDEVAPVLDDSVALVALSHVSYLSGAVVDMAAITNAARTVGALTLWDLSHSAGSVPVDLASADADLAVGCTYKYLNGGPGAPAYLFVRSALRGALPVSLPGWFGHRDVFAFDDEYQPANDMRRFLVGTPPILSMAAAIPGIAVVAEAGIEAIRRKSLSATRLAIELTEEWLAPYGVTLGSPTDATRGSHLALRHPDALPLSRWLRDEGVIVDFRNPDVIRVAVAPLTTSYCDVWDGLDRLRQGLAGACDLAAYTERPTVT